MFPAPAGMSPAVSISPYIKAYVPRTRGDEPPAEHLLEFNIECSPHPRG